jgi:hypothetical protein
MFFLKEIALERLERYVRVEIDATAFPLDEFRSDRKRQTFWPTWVMRIVVLKVLFMEGFRIVYHHKHVYHLVRCVLIVISLLEHRRPISHSMHNMLFSKIVFDYLLQ